MMHTIQRPFVLLYNHGPAYTLRRALYKYYHTKFARLSRRQAQRYQSPSMIRFLNNDFELHPSMEGLSEELYLYGQHEPTASSYYRKLLSPGDHVIDVGSNLGYYVFLARKCIGTAGRILAFEPAPGIYEILERNVHHSQHKNIETHQCALGLSLGTLDFFESQIPNWGSILPNPDLLQTGRISVPSRTLDSIMDDFPEFNPSVVRMDVEGAEVMILKGGEKLLAKHRPNLFIEFHNFALGWPAVHDALLNLSIHGYASGIMIQRSWDQPWMPRIIRERRCWKGSIHDLIARAERARDPLKEATLIFLLRASCD